MNDKRKGELPSWFIGLLLAAVIFVVALFLLDYLGYGDDPVVDPGASATLVLKV